MINISKSTRDRAHKIMDLSFTLNTLEGVVAWFWFHAYTKEFVIRVTVKSDEIYFDQIFFGKQENKKIDIELDGAIEKSTEIITKIS